MPPEPDATATESPPKLISSIQSLPPGQSGFTDPWCLVEGLNPVVPIPPDPDNPETMVAPPDPRSGMCYLWPSGNVYDKVNGDHTMPIKKDENENLVVDLPAGYYLANPLRQESPGALQGGAYRPCFVNGLKAALAPPPACTAAPASPVDTSPAPSDPPAADDKTTKGKAAAAKP
jgi:hypothetical protein